MSVGKNIRIRREERRLSQKEMAKMTGISQAMLCQIERGTKNPSIQIGKEIANILGCSMEDLLTDD